MITRVKICCISSHEEAGMAIKYGASALGLVGNMPSGPGVVSDELIYAISQTVPPSISTFMLTSETVPEEIIAHHRRTFTNTIQIVDSLNHSGYKILRKALPAVKIVQVIHVTDESSIDDALEIAEMTDALLLDSGNPKLQVKELGGTGRVHNWQISRRIVAQSGVPVFLAGGLKPENVKAAIETVQPFGVDVCSGVRTANQLDPYKLEKFFEQIFK
ncbi:MAG: phosphoribosylanthranilate isomerase [Ginsengibacter sp.]